MVAAARQRWGVAGLVFASGLCALIYQVAWLRELRLVFGASTPASAAVLAVFMGGLGVGGLLLGRRAERSAQPLAFFGRLEIVAGLGAGLSPWTIAAARAVYLALGGSASLGLVGGTVVRLLLTALVLGVPMVAMGGTLPAVARAAMGSGDPARRSLGWLYGCNTLGAVAGAGLTTFVMLEHLGQRKSLWVAALLDVLVGMVALSLARRGVGAAGEALAEGGEETSETPAARAAAAPLALVLVAAGLVGFAFFLMELVWYRVLAPLLGGTTYTFGLILLLALLGIGGGGLLYGAVARRRPPSLGAFASTCALEALLLVVPLALSFRLAVLASALRTLGAFGFGGMVAGWLVVGGIVVVPPSLVAGYQFPLLVALLGTGRREVAVQTGLVAASNTAGAIAGSLAGGFGLLPLLGAPGAWRATTLLLAGLALAAVLAWRRGEPGGRPLLQPLVALAAAALCLAPGPSALWRFGEIG
ncbi:MAG TPA: spermidine synthase, partial [Thermoanaerobaculia bacterium]|nr:spermidine synthase [Thermoanaerobaculia bacterium]